MKNAVRSSRWDTWLIVRSGRVAVDAQVPSSAADSPLQPGEQPVQPAHGQGHRVRRVHRRHRLPELRGDVREDRAEPVRQGVQGRREEEVRVQPGLRAREAAQRAFHDEQSAQQLPEHAAAD